MSEWPDDIHETNRLLREVLIPHVIRLELEIASLRKHVWPYVQCRKETNQLGEMEEKIQFLNELDDQTVKELVHLKAKYSKTPGLQGREYDIIQSYRKNMSTNNK